VSLWPHVGGAVVVGGLLTVERKAFLQAALSRPVVASALIGACFGEVPAALVVGAPLELLFLGSANLGASLADHETLAACAVAACSAVAARCLGGLSLPAATLALLVLVPFGVAGRLLDTVDNRVHQHFADRALVLVEQGKYGKALRMNWRSLWFPWLLGGLAVALGSAAGLGLGALVPGFSLRMDRALAAAFLFSSAVCAAAAWSSRWARRR
jgi:mannose/fructose/N-acetylgalactosamine-specific phosphotransferase system component IIC